MSETRKLTDPFTGQEVEISDNLIDRLHGKYACGPTLENGEPEFGWRQMPTIPIQVEAATEIVALHILLARAQADANRLADVLKRVEAALHDAEVVIDADDNVETFDLVQDTRRLVRATLAEHDKAQGGGS